MKKVEMTTKAENDLRDRTKQFALQIIRTADCLLCDSMDLTPGS